MLIINGKLVTWGEAPELIEGGALRIVDGVIQAVGPSDSLAAQYPDDEVVDAGGQYVMPGNICAHTHFYGAFSRGMAIPGPAPKDFPEILERLWWPLDKALDADAVRLSALVSLVDAIKHGTTTLIDHHASPNAIAGSLDVIADAVDSAGLRAVLCYEVTDRDGPEKTRAGIDENARFLEAARGRELVSATFGLHAGLTVGDDTLAASVEAAKAFDSGFHIHVAEHEADEYHSLQQHGMRVVERLHKFGVLGPRTIVAHCVHTDPWELALLRETGTWISHQPRSNMNNAVGAAPLDALLAGGVNVVLGNDGFSNNMWAEWKAAYFLHKVVNRDPRRAPGDGIARMAVANNARLAEVFFPEQRIGSLEVGAAADLILVNYQPFTPLTIGNLPWHIIFGFESSMVSSTMVNGRWLMRDRRLLTVDETAIAAEARALAPQVWERYGQEVAKVLAG
ncbi:MAG: putative aminohydrolase SsnA [Anaerolineae bacterium]|nr:putative aminohydrolase SsnA [Anaerolineae bacterium]